MCPNEGKRDGAVNGRCLVHMVFTVVGNPLVSTGDGKAVLVGTSGTECRVIVVLNGQSV